MLTNGKYQPIKFTNNRQVPLSLVLYKRTWLLTVFVFFYLICLISNCFLFYGKFILRKILHCFYGTRYRHSKIVHRSYFFDADPETRLIIDQF
jgi:hypothetical protein